MSENLRTLNINLNELSMIESELHIKPKNCLERLNEIIDIANKPLIILEAMKLRSFSLWLLGRQNEAFFSANELLETAKEENNNNYIAIALNGIGLSFIEWGREDEAYEHFKEALEIVKTDIDKYTECAIYSNLGELSDVLSVDVRLDMYEKSYQISMEIDRKDMIYDSLNGLANIYIELENHDKALEILEKLRNYFPTMNNIRYKGITLHSLGQVYRFKKRFEESIKYLKEAIDLFEESEMKVASIRVKIDYIELLIEMENNTLAIELIDQILKMNGDVSSKYLSKLMHTRSNINYGNGNFKAAYDDMERYTELIIEREQESYIKKMAMNRATSQVELHKLEKKLLLDSNTKLTGVNQELLKSLRNSNFVTEMGKEIATILNIEKLFISIYTNINKILEVSFLSLARYDDRTGIINFPFAYENSEYVTISCTTSEDYNSIVAYSIRKDVSILIGDFTLEHEKYVKMRGTRVFGDSVRSIIVVPLHVNNAIIGAISIQSRKENMYSLLDLQMVEAIGAFISIALLNSEKNTLLKSEVSSRIKTENELRKSNDLLSELHMTDQLTQVSNRRWLENYFEYNKTLNHGIVSVMIFDIDYFKQYNDNYGHQEGDECLKKVASLVSNLLVKKNQYLVRFGGDEFVVILDDTSTYEATQVANNICLTINDSKIKHEYSKISDNVTVTLGACIGAKSEIDYYDKFLKIADDTLYIAKNNGRNNAVINESLNDV